MHFIINEKELSLLYGLPHIQQLIYLRGIRPYMDVMTGLVGIKRGISHQSIAEQIYIEPHPGIKSITYSRMQIRRALTGLDRIGLISIQSEGLKLILKCNVASLGYFVQNKADINPTQKDTLLKSANYSIHKGFTGPMATEPNLNESQKPATPLKEDNYIYLLSQFENFWSLYPEKKSKHKAQAAFEELNPDDHLFQELIQALQNQIKHIDALKRSGTWTPPWKYPANWLTQHCWKDELSTDILQETQRAAHTKNNRKGKPTADLFSPPCEADDDESGNNIIEFRRYSERGQAH